jgi:hypothetical protein
MFESFDAPIPTGRKYDEDIQPEDPIATRAA